jgi:hypothetical protein
MMIFVSIITPREPQEQLDEFYALLHTPVGKEERRRFPRLYRRGTYCFRLRLSSNSVAENGSHPRLYRWGTPAKLDMPRSRCYTIKIHFMNNFLKSIPGTNTAEFGKNVRYLTGQL